MASVKSRQPRDGADARGGGERRARSGRQAVSNERPKARLTPIWLVTIVFCVLLIYVVVKKVDDVSEVKFQGSGIAFRAKSPSTLAPDDQRQRAQQIQAKLEAQVRNASPSEAPPSPVDLTGTWTTFDGRVTWTLTIENGYLVLREQNASAPGVVSAVGYGTFDGRTWSPQFQTIFGEAGTATLNLEDDDILRGEAIVSGNRFSLALRR